MIQMQRSLSLPGPAHASPPTSPTITHVSSRSPTPSPSEKHIVPPRIHRYQSRSPNRPPTSYREQPTERERTRSTTRTSSPTPVLRRQDVTPLPKAKEPSEPPTSPTKLPPLPLLQDISQYVNPQMSAVIETGSNTTLEELAHLVRLSTYQERKRIHSRIRLQRSLVSTALSARLARCGDLAHRTLVDNFRIDEKKGFASLYNAIHDVRNSCDATRKYALLEPDLDHGRSNPAGGDDNGSLSTFMHEIPLRTKETFLKFLTQIRTNPDYLASRLTSLTQAELSALTVFHQGLEPVESVLPFHNNRPKTSSAHRSSAYIPTPVERLLSFQRHDPLSALIHTCFANSAGPDSIEDRRRTDVWATACARLVKDNRLGTDPFLCSVLNIWVAMRDWSGRSNMEWYLMKILEDGAFLLDKPEDQAGTRIHVEPRSAKDSIAADEFYDAAVLGLFAVVDDPGTGGIPEGLVELGNAILRKLDTKLHHAVRKFFISKWLFSVFLLNAIIHPETYGMMNDYHITEYGRQKILKEVAMRAQKLVVTRLWEREPKNYIPPLIKDHVDNIMARFRPSRPSKTTPKLLPARSITSLRETAEVHPYLVLAPADLMVMVNALFPERRPASSSMSRDHLSDLRSGASSVSGISAASRQMPNPRSTFDNMSIMSNSGSSVISDITTSREPLLHDNSNGNQKFPTASLLANAHANQRLSDYEDDSFELRIAIHEITQALGSENIAGACHPCAESWSVLFMSPDGQKLSTQMLHDPDDEADEEEFTSSSDSDDADPTSRSDLDKDYHQLRDSILKLVEDYEIPQSYDSKSESMTFSNRTSVLESPRKKHRSRPSSSSQPQSNNPYRKRNQSPAEATKRAESNGRTTPEMESPSVLITMLEAAGKQCQAQSDFVNAHLYWKTLNQLHQLSSRSLKQDGYASLLSIFSRGPRDTIRRATGAVEEYDAWLVWLKQSQERHDTIIDSMMKRLKSLRDKMWYVTDVRNSKPYENARSIAVALKSMVTPKKSSTMPPPITMRPRNGSRLAANNFLLKSEAQVLAEISASEQQGGPNKLSDEQSENTERWLSRFGIENFCKGEERIHRFCLEIETCINKLVGENMIEAPDLWASDLYIRDKRILDSGRQKGDLFSNSFRALNLSGDDMNEPEAGRRGLRSTDFNRAGNRDLRAMSMRNGSQQSFDSGRYSMSRISTSDLHDSQDYFGMASPVLTIDSATTFWSPFQSSATRAQSPTTSIGSVRPGTSSSANETVMLREERSNLAKQRFVVDLKQTLTSLLVSDLGTLVFARGSETDAWFSSDLGQDCMDRKERLEKKARKKSKRRTLEKKRSFRDLRSAHNTDLPFERPEGIYERPEKGATSGLLRPVDPNSQDVHSVADSASTNDTVVSGSRKAAKEVESRKGIIKDMESPDFPYRNAFQRLLRMFSVHPNPYAKLNALFELEQLIIAYLTPSAPRRPRVRMESLTPSTESHNIDSFASREAALPYGERAKNLGETIDNCKERRSHTVAVESPSPVHRVTERSLNSPPPATTDMIVDVLQDLFRDAEIRPKTLFRDLQFIASFVPAAVLDKTERGKAFWDAGLAALGLKQDVCRTMIEVADEVVQHNIRQLERRKTSASIPDSIPSIANGDFLKYGMEDAAKMLSITAKEGEPAAERELGIFYIAHPDLVEKVIAPLSKPHEIFKAQVMGGGSAGSNRADPATMCVAFHWMELSALAGDEVAKGYLEQRESREINEIA